MTRDKGLQIFPRARVQRDGGGWRAGAWAEGGEEHGDVHDELQLRGHRREHPAAGPGGGVQRPHGGEGRGVVRQ